MVAHVMQSLTYVYVLVTGLALHVTQVKVGVGGCGWWMVGEGVRVVLGQFPPPPPGQFPPDSEWMG